MKGRGPRMTPWDVRPLLGNIRFFDRPCSDGQCCAYALDDPDLPSGPFRAFYWILRYRRALSRYSSYVLRAACPDLRIEFSADPPVLSLGTSCGIYARRPPECREFGVTRTCNFEEYVTAVERDRGYHWLFLLVLEKETFLPAYPFLESFDLALRFPEFSRVRPPSAVPDALLIPLPADRSMLPDGRGT